MSVIDLKKQYKEKLVKSLQKELDCNAMNVPRILKITLNMGLGGAAIADKKQVIEAKEDLALIAGQLPIVTLTRKSIAGFKIREGWPIGVKVTLRRDAMWDFLQRLIFVVVPRIRDFRGLTKRSFDGRGNYSFGIREHVVFPEIDYDKADRLRGLDITISTSAGSDEAGYALLSQLSFPFKEKVAELQEQEG
jgi:large subunit ribosomal protein L5